MTLQYLINASLSKFTNMSYSLTPLTVSGPLCLGHGHREDINIKAKDQLMSVRSRRPRNALYFQTGKGFGGRILLTHVQITLAGVVCVCGRKNVKTQGKETNECEIEATRTVIYSYFQEGTGVGKYCRKLFMTGSKGH